MRSPFLLAFLALLCFSNFHPVSASLYKTLMAEAQQHQDEQHAISRNLRRFLHEDEYDEKNNDAQQERELIINGDDAQAGVYPWFTELLAYPEDGNPLKIRRCGGAMLSGDVVLTVANCLYDLDGNFADRTASRAIIKREGNVKRGNGVGKTWKVIRPHPNHVFPSLEFNVAIIQLSGNKLFPEYDIGDLNSLDVNPPVGSSLTGVGYGGGFETLQEANFTVTDSAAERCQIPSDQYLFCLQTASLDGSTYTVNGETSSSDSTDEEEVPDFCPGDEGAPLVFGFGSSNNGYQTVFGLYASLPDSCRLGTTDSIAVKIAPYRSFILNTLCEIANARCIESCSLFASLSGFAAESVQTVGGFVGGIWQFFAGDTPALTETPAFPDDGGP